MCPMCAIYVFNLEYPTKLKKTFEFFQLNFLDLPVSQPAKVVKTLAVKLVQ